MRSQQDRHNCLLRRCCFYWASLNKASMCVTARTNVNLNGDYFNEFTFPRLHHDCVFSQQRSASTSCNVQRRCFYLKCDFFFCSHIIFMACLNLNGKVIWILSPFNPGRKPWSFCANVLKLPTHYACACVIFNSFFFFKELKQVI